MTRSNGHSIEDAQHVESCSFCRYWAESAGVAIQASVKAGNVVVLNARG